MRGLTIYSNQNSSCFVEVDIDRLLINLTKKTFLDFCKLQFFLNYFISYFLLLKKQDCIKIFYQMIDYQYVRNYPL